MKLRPILVCLTMIGVAIFTVYTIQNSRTPATVSTVNDTSGTRETSSKGGRTATVPKQEERPVREAGDDNETTYWKRESKPFSVVKSSERFEWTDKDCKDPEAIKMLANNPDMVEAITESNIWTKRRQLVYVNPEFTEKAEQIFRKELKEIVLPGFDGEEFHVDIDMATDFGGWISGSFTGDVRGHDHAKVVAGSDKNYWSIGLQFNDRHYQIENREPGEWIISEINLAAMSAHFGPCKVERTVDDVGTPQVSN